MSEEEPKIQVSIVDSTENEAEPDQEHDPYYDPIISLPEVVTSTNEEDEIELIKLRAKLYRYNSSEDPPEWKERGTGDVKLLRHQTKHTVRIVMRRDKTLKICANHFVTPYMELKPNCGSDRAWIWSTLADFTDEQAQPETLAIRFASAENAKKWKDMFEEAKTIVATQCELYTQNHDDDSKEEEHDSTTESVESGGEAEIETTLQNLNLSESKKEAEDSKTEKVTEDSPEK